MQHTLLVGLALVVMGAVSAAPVGFSPEQNAADETSGAMMCDVYDLDSCPTGEGCYLSIQTGATDCAIPSQFGVQHDNCEFVNACEPGLGCILNNDPVNPTGLACAHFCNPRSGVTAQGGFCSDVPELEDGATVCVALDEFYFNSDLRIGMCVDCDIYPCDKLYVSSFESGQ